MLSRILAVLDKFDMVVEAGVCAWLRFLGCPSPNVPRFSQPIRARNYQRPCSSKLSPKLPK